MSHLHARVSRLSPTIQKGSKYVQKFTYGGHDDDTTAGCATLADQFLATPLDEPNSVSLVIVVASSEVMVGTLVAVFLGVSPFLCQITFANSFNANYLAAG